LSLSISNSRVRIPGVQARIKEMSEELAQETLTQNDINSTMNDLQFSIREPTVEMESSQRELDSLRDPREIFCSRLNGREQDVVKAYRWVQANKARFQGECYGPIGMEIQVRSADIPSH
jgi:chromosome segregation ATPase